jgi:hypothetical protein
MLHYEIPNTARRVCSPRGEVDVWLATPSVLMTVSRGYLSADMIDSVLEAIDEMTHGLPEFHFFADAMPMVNYEPEYRVTFTEWVRENRPRILGIHVLFRSKAVQLALSIINLVTGGTIFPYRGYTEFNRQLEALGASPLQAYALSQAAGR